MKSKEKQKDNGKIGNRLQLQLQVFSREKKLKTQPPGKPGGPGNRQT
jgi:hypothetical protein